jgi:hypothetical protein
MTTQKPMQKAAATPKKSGPRLGQSVEAFLWCGSNGVEVMGNFKYSGGDVPVNSTSSDKLQRPQRSAAGVVLNSGQS